LKIVVIVAVLCALLVLLVVARSRRTAATALSADEEWARILVDGHEPLRMMQTFMRRIPSPPRCKLCFNPFGGVAGRIAGLLGFRRSRKNPNLCTRCCDRLPPGGAEIDVAILFADVRGSTGLAEQRTASDYAALLNRFYRVSTDVLVAHDAIVDKLIGDEVMALFVPGIAGPDYRRKAGDAAAALLRAVEDRDGPWLEVGLGVNAGIAYVGNVGEAVVDFTALGDAVNVAARLQSHANPGEAVLSREIHQVSAGSFTSAEERTITVAGRVEPVAVVAARPSSPG
jgi:adenylate cyclase